MTRTVTANISLSLDGRVNGPGGDFDMSWIVPHAITEGAREHMLRVTGPATTALLGRKNYEGFGGFWPAVADDETAAPQDRAFSRWLNETDKVVFSSTLTEAPWANSRIADGEPAELVARSVQQHRPQRADLAVDAVRRTVLPRLSHPSALRSRCPTTLRQSP